MKREFNIGDIAHLTNGKRMKGYNLPVETGVEIIGYKRISKQYGAYSYGVKVTNPKTGKEEIYEDWFTQFDFMTKETAKKMNEQNRLISDLMKRNKESK